jgi:hypothetical protein
MAWGVALGAAAGVAGAGAVAFAAYRSARFLAAPPPAPAAERRAALEAFCDQIRDDIVPGVRFLNGHSAPSTRAPAGRRRTTALPTAAPAAPSQPAFS